MKDPRTQIAAALEKQASPAAHRLAAFIRQGELNEALPCWGGIAEHFDTMLQDHEACREVLEALLEVGDARALMLFVHAHLNRPRMLRVLAEALARLPIRIQRVLASLEATRALIRHDTLDKRVRPLTADNNAIARQREVEAFRARVAKLQTYRFFVQDAFEPSSEPNP